MRIAVYGLWHLGCVTAACLASAGNQVVGLDLDELVVADLQRGQLPLYEPGLADLIVAGLTSGQLSFTSNAADALGGVEVLWVAFDTPVNEQDEADVEFVRARLEAIVEAIPRNTLVLISSQVPVGFTRGVEHDWQTRGLRYAYSPENLRLGKALEAFQKPERVIIGLRDQADQSLLAALFAPFCQRFEWMSVESAEMTKHALNAFLATSVTFINELARLCEVLGADAKEVERGLKSEGRIGPRAYLAPGAAFAGGTLARDLRFLVEFGQRYELATPLLSGVLASNEVHKDWVRTTVRRLLGSTVQPVVAILGLTYKPETSTLRRSSSVELCVWLHQQGVGVQAHDPAIADLPDELRPMITLCTTPEQALAGADVAVVATEWPAYRNLAAEQLLEHMRRPQVVDQNRFLVSTLGDDARILYIATGKANARPSSSNQ
jgi:UDPglucose 6-dehydrogenase